MAPTLHTALVLSLLFSGCAAADDGDDFSNNLFSDLAPILALFGERVTMQFLSQSMGWADCIMLAMAPLGIITTIVSAIRVGGPPWLKAIVGRSMENLSAAEMELMSSTSHEACELWNGKDVMTEDNESDYEKVRVMQLKDTLGEDFNQILKRGKSQAKDSQRRGDHTPNPHCDEPPHTGNSGQRRRGRGQLDEEAAAPPPIQKTVPHKQNDSWITITRNTQASAPNITLNRPENAGRVELRLFAALGILLQCGVVLFFGFISYYPTQRFEKNDRPVTRYAFPVAATGTLFLVLGMLICAHVVDSSTDETNYKVLKGRKVQLVWLQQANKVSDQVFLPVAIYRQKPCKIITTSRRVTKRKSAQSHHNSKPSAQPKPLGQHTETLCHTSNHNQEAHTQSTNPSVQSLQNSQSLSTECKETRSVKPGTAIELKAILGAAICLAGFVIQFVGLRSMHWSASVAQLGAVFTMTVLRTVVRRGFTDPIDSQVLTEGHELDWFVFTLADLRGASWCKVLINEGNGSNTTWWTSLSQRWLQVRQILSGKGSKEESEETVWAWKVKKEPYCKGLAAKTDESLPRSELDEPSPGIAPDESHSGTETGRSSPGSELREPSTGSELDGSLSEHELDGSAPPSEPDEPSTRTVANESLPKTLKEQTQHLETLDRFTAQGALNLRKDLASLFDWRGPASEEAVCLAQAMEVVLNTLRPVDQTQPDHHFDWYLEVGYAPSNIHKPKLQKVYFHLLWDEREKWKARADELEAALSLWLYSGRKQEVEDTSFQFPPAGDNWLREKGLRPKLSHRRLDLSTPRLVRDLRWWMPSEGFSILQSIPSSEASSPDRVIEEEPPTAVSADRKPLPSDLGNDSDVEDEQEDTKDKRILVVESYDVRKKAYAKDMFSAFLWAVAETQKQLLDSDSKLQQTGVEKGSGGNWQSYSLQSDRLSKLAQDIQNTGLESLNDAYLSIIPPFSHYERLPEPNTDIEQAFEGAKRQEKLLQWEDASNTYAWLLSVATRFPKRNSIYTKAVAICMRYLDTRKSDTRIRNFYDWGEFYDYPKRLEKKPEQEEARLTKRLEKLKRGSDREDFDTLQSDLGILCDSQLEFISKDTLQKRHFKLAIKRFWPQADKSIHSRDVMGRTQLHYAAATDNYLSTKKLLASNASSKVTDIRDVTPLHYACHYGHLVVASQLLEQNAKVDAQDLDGHSPLHLAALKGHEHVAESLIRYRCSTRLRDNYGRLPIHCAAMNGHVSVVEKLLAYAKDHVRDNRNRTVLHYAAWFGKLDVLALLTSTMKLDLNLEAVDYLDCTALHLAAEKGHGDIVKLLIDTGANIEARCRHWNSTPLHLAAAKGHQDVIVSLVERNPGLCKIKDENRRTPLQVAGYHKRIDVFKHLRYEGDNFDPEYWDEDYDGTDSSEMSE